MNQYYFSPLFLLSLTALLQCCPDRVLAAQEQALASDTIILQQTDATPGASFTELDMVPIDERHMLTALRESDTSKPVYTLSVSDALLMDVLNALATSMKQRITPANSATSSDAGTLIILDDLATQRRVTMSVEQSDLTSTVDMIAIASNCNIYLENLSIVVDQCR